MNDIKYLLAGGVFGVLLHQFCYKNSDNPKPNRKFKVIKNIVMKDISSELISPIGDKVIFTINIDGDTSPEFKNIDSIVTSILFNIKDGDEVIININSPGGSYIDFCDVYNHLERLKSKRIYVDFRMIVFIKKIAASGGYLLASIGDQIYGSADCVVGSIGVYKTGFNFSKLLKLFSIDYKTYKSCDYKNIGDPYDEVTEQGSEKMQKDVARIHDRFTKTIKKYRKNVDDNLFDADTWYGDEAVKNGLIDGIKIVDDYIMEKAREYRVYNVGIANNKSEKFNIFDVILNFL